ncbi:unnamed protein product [Candidula unifasciata]|uniref:Uncharacterized protein n=1 Tax=Candidula unifasciata TaxID=100452 RepID=A0A8S4A0E0_9EUPU|nr:unnamed protein product [Candidula unifasciata]
MSTFVEKMSVDGARDINSFFSSRVGFGEPPPTATSSLLTFADMVLALDRQNICGDLQFQSSGVDVSTGSDHTYASNGFTRTTRSQTAKVVAHLSGHLSGCEDKEKLKVPVENGDDVTKAFSKGSCLSHNNTTSSAQTDSHNLKIKRCLSVEKMCGGDTANLKVCEWPEVVSKHSPKKSSSFEEVNCGNRQSCMKSSKSTEHVQKTGVSHTLHRVINNTLEFPCWPRKADHTYATATWDGTASSHSLFEQELHRDSAKQHIIEDQEMEDTEDCILQNQCPRLGTTSEQQLSNFPGLAQKDDHTYVKSKVPDFNSPGSIDIEAFSLVTEGDANRTPVFSSATFPRQKMREDHTYFHSGLSRKNSSGVGRREWASTQTVAAAATNLQLAHDVQVEEAYRNLNSFSQSASAKKDHNYSTSA